MRLIKVSCSISIRMRHAGVFQPKAYADSAIQRHGLSDSEPCRLCEFMVQMLIADHHFALFHFDFTYWNRGGVPVKIRIFSKALR